MNQKDEKEASGVRAMPPPPLPAAPSGDSSLFVEVNRHSTFSRSSTEESSIVAIKTLQRMKAEIMVQQTEMMVQQTEMMQHMENEIEGVIRKHQMQGEDGMLILSTTDEERFEEDGTEKVRWQNSNMTHSFTVDCMLSSLISGTGTNVIILFVMIYFFLTIFQLEEGNGRKWFYDLGSKKALSSNQRMWKKKEDTSANIEHSANEIIFLTRGEVDRMKRVAEEQARSIEEMKKEHVTSRKFEETIEETSQKVEELRFLVANPSDNSDQRQNLNISPNQPGHRRQSQRMNPRSMFGRTSSALLECSDSISLDWDTFSLMMISPVCSQSWILGCVSPLL